MRALQFLELQILNYKALHLNCKSSGTYVFSPKLLPKLPDRLRHFPIALPPDY